MDNRKGKKKDKSEPSSLAVVFSSIGRGGSSSSAAVLSPVRSELMSHIRQGKRTCTLLGAHQGDHVSAHALFLHIIESKIRDCDREIAVKRLYHLIINMYKNVCSIDSHVYEEMGGKIKKFEDDYFSESEKAGVQSKYNKLKEDPSKILRGMDNSNELIFTNILEGFTEIYLKKCNREEYVSFPSEGNVEPPRGEGSRIVTALQNLQRISDGIDETEDELDLSTIRNIAQNMFLTFWYPRIPQRLLIDHNSEQWQAIVKKKRYNRDTKPRDNNLETLYRVTANHLALILECYEAFCCYQWKEIVNEFLELVASTGTIVFQDENNVLQIMEVHWSMNKSQYREFSEGVYQLLPPYLHEYTKGASDSEASESSTGESSNVTSSEGSNEDPEDLNYKPR